MGSFKLIFTLFLIPLFLFAEIEDQLISTKNQIYYLLKTKEFQRAIDIYHHYRSLNQKHDFEILEQMALIILEDGFTSRDPEKQLLSLYGIDISSYNPPLYLLEMGMKSKNPYVLAATIHMLGKVAEDKSEEILRTGLGLPFFVIQLETANELARKRFPSASSLIESLMYKFPPQLRVYFPEFFGMIGTPEALTMLTNLINDSSLSVRLSSFLCAAKYGRDDLVSYIRSASTHVNQAEQEVCARALGILKDSNSTDRLKTLAGSPIDEVKLAACFSLYELGNADYAEHVIDLAKKKNLFAIRLLAQIPSSKEILHNLVKDPDLTIKMNAALSLLELREKAAAPALLEILVQDGRDLAIYPAFSAGKALQCFKIMPSAAQVAEKTKSDLLGITLSVRERILTGAMNLPEEAFLKIADILFQTRQHPLIPLLVHLLENLQTPEAIKLLEKHSDSIGSPLIRGFCKLALYRLGRGGPFKENFLSWIDEEKKTRLIRFRQMLPWTIRENEFPFELTPEEKSRLLIESFEAISDRHEEESIEILLSAIKEGHEMNRYALAGLLLRCIQ